MPMQRTETLSDLTQIFRDLFDDDTLVITPATTAKDVPGWDSFMHINLIVASESFFKVKFQTGEIESLKDVGSLVGLIDAKRAN